MPPNGKIFDTPEVLAYTYIGLTVRFQLCSSINVQLTLSYNRCCIEMSPKMRFWGDFWGRAKILGVKVHPSSELCVFRHLWSRSDVPCSSILHGYSYLPFAIDENLGKFGYPSSNTRSRRKTPEPEGTPLDLRLPRGKIVIILRCNPWAVGWSPEGMF